MTQINRIRLQNFKAIRDLTFELRPLTLLSGLNDTGKSALWEALLLLKQSESSKYLILNGAYLQAGTVGEVLCDTAPESAAIAIEITGEGFDYRWQFDPWSMSASEIPPAKDAPLPPLDLNLPLHYFSPRSAKGEILCDHLAGIRPGEIIILNHPEHRLHGSLATQVGREIADVVARGAQVIVETHSDHILNGIRLAVHAGELAPDLVRFLHFHRSDDLRELKVDRLKIDRRGRIDRWPDRFFDEWEKSLDLLLEKIDA